MTKSSVIFIVLFLTGLIISSCEKEDLVDTKNELFPENSEKIIDGVLFVDGVSQQESITDFNLENVRVKDGRLVFADHAAFMSGIEKIAKYNSESVAAWSEKIGFTSLYTELIRLEEQPLETIEEVLMKDTYKEYFLITDQEELELTKHSRTIARIYNTQGLVQVGEFVGTISPGLNVWVRERHVDKLINALTNHYIPENDRDFIVVRKEALGLSRDWVALDNTCPRLSWLTPVYQYKNPNQNRRIEVQNSWFEVITPTSGGNYNADYIYQITTISKKASWNKYKTNHYLSIDFRFQEVLNGNPSSVYAIQDSETVFDVKEASLGVVVVGFSNVSLSFLNNNYLRLYEVLPGNSGLSGTAGSHRGMNGLYGRQECH